MREDVEIVLGPPGTGKTTRLIGMVEEELDRGTPPDRIGYISFTKKAAEEARDRAAKRFGLTPKELPWFRTIHSLCFSALGLSSAEVFEGKKIKEFGDWIGVDVSAYAGGLEEGGTFGYKTGDRCIFMENLARVRRIPLRKQYEEDSDNLPWSVVDRVARGMEQFKKAKGLVDFTDMLTEFVKSDWDARLECLFVDEAQDLSILQWDVVEKLARSPRRVVIAGDDDQAIYRWAGAAVQHFIDLPGQASVLSQSWRVPASVQTVAHELISRVRTRREKHWRPREGDGGVVSRIGSLDGLDFAKGEQMLILARNASHLRDDAIPLLRSEGIIYEFRGAPSVRRTVIDAILNWERLRRGERIPVSAALKMYEWIETGPNGIERGHKKLPSFSDKDEMVGIQDLRTRGGLRADGIWHDALNKLTREDRAYMVRALRRGDSLTERPRVQLSTIHASKGGQADHVVLLRDVAWRTMKESAALHEDEARTFYVAVTRAKERLTIVAPQTRHSYDV